MAAKKKRERFVDGEKYGITFEIDEALHHIVSDFSLKYSLHESVVLELMLFSLTERTIDAVYGRGWDECVTSHSLNKLETALEQDGTPASKALLKRLETWKKPPRWVTWQVVADWASKHQNVFSMVGSDNRQNVRLFLKGDPDHYLSKQQVFSEAVRHRLVRDYQGWLDKLASHRPANWQRETPRPDDDGYE